MVDVVVVVCIVVYCMWCFLLCAYFLIYVDYYYYYSLRCEYGGVGIWHTGYSAGGGVASRAGKHLFYTHHGVLIDLFYTHVDIFYN